MSGLSVEELITRFHGFALKLIILTHQLHAEGVNTACVTPVSMRLHMCHTTLLFLQCTTRSRMP